MTAPASAPAPSPDPLAGRAEAAETRVAASGAWMAGGAAWLVGLRLTTRLAGLINMIVLARVIAPEAFGVVALAVATLAALEAVTDIGPDMVLAQRKHVSRAHYDTVFTFLLLRNGVIAAAAALSAPGLAQFFDAPALELVVYVIAVRVALLGLRNPGAAAFGRTLDYRRHTLLRGLPRLATVVVALTLGLTIWPDHRALAAGLLAEAVLAVCLSYAMHPFRPRLSLARWRSLFGASAAMTAYNLAFFALARLDAFILARVAGPGAVSIFALASELARLAVTELAGPVSQALSFGFARHAADADALKRQFLESLGVLFAIAAPMAAGAGLVAAPAVMLVFGPVWIEAAGLLEILWIAGLAFAVSRQIGALMLAQRRQGEMAACYFLAAALAAPTMAIAGAEYGPTGVAWGFVVGHGALLAAATALAVYRFRLPMRAFAAATLRPLLALPPMALAVAQTQALGPTPDGATAAALSLMMSVAVGAPVYALALLGLWALAGRPDGAERMLLSSLKRRPAAACSAP